MDANMERFRISVGRAHGANPGNIVGAIAGAAGIEGRYIGRIRLHDNFSLVDLPVGMPEDILFSLQNVTIQNAPLRIQRDSGTSEMREDESRPRNARGPKKKERGPKKFTRKKPAAKNARPKKKKRVHKSI
jgi:ATP-dependent RNA helicase DeaD